MSEKRVYSAVKAIVLNEKKFFLVIEQVIGNQTFWELPGGRIEYGESPLQALKREVKEETDLDIEIDKVVGVWWFFRVKDGDQVICTTFLCTPANTRVDLTKNPSVWEASENKSFKWVSKKEFLNEKYAKDRSNSSLEELIKNLDI